MIPSSKGSSFQSRRVVSNNLHTDLLKPRGTDQMLPHNQMGHLQTNLHQVEGSNRPHRSVKEGHNPTRPQEAVGVQQRESIPYLKDQLQGYEKKPNLGGGLSFKNQRFRAIVGAKKLRAEPASDRILTESILKEHLRVQEISAEKSYHFDPQESRLLSPEEPQSSSTLMDIKYKLNEAFGFEDDLLDDSPLDRVNIRTLEQTPAKNLEHAKKPSSLKKSLQSPHPAVSASMQSNMATRQSSQVYDYGATPVDIRGLGLLHSGQLVHNLILGNSVNVNLSVNPVSASQTNRRKGGLKTGSGDTGFPQDHQCSPATCPLCLGPIPATSNGFSKKKMSSKLAALGKVTADIGKLIPGSISTQVPKQLVNLGCDEAGLFRSSQKKTQHRPRTNTSLNGAVPNSSKAVSKSLKQKRHQRTNTSGPYPAVVSTLFSANFDDSKAHTALNRSSNAPKIESRSKNISMIQKIFSKKQSLNPTRPIKEHLQPNSRATSLRRDDGTSKTRALRSLLVTDSNDSFANFNLLLGKANYPVANIGVNTPSHQPNVSAGVWKKKGVKNSMVSTKKTQKKPAKVQNLFENKRMSYEFALNHSQVNPFSNKHLPMNMNTASLQGAGVLRSLAYSGLEKQIRAGNQQASQVNPSLYSSQLWDNNQNSLGRPKYSIPNEGDLTGGDRQATVTRLFGKKSSDPVPKGHSFHDSPEIRAVFDRKKRSVDHQPQTPVLPYPSNAISASVPTGLPSSLASGQTEQKQIDTSGGSQLENHGDWVKKMLIKKKKKQAQGARKPANQVSMTNYESIIKSNNFFKFKSAVRGEPHHQLSASQWRQAQRGLANRSQSSQKGSKTRASSPKYPVPDLKADYTLPEPALIPGWAKPSSGQPVLKDVDSKQQRQSTTTKTVNLQSSLYSNQHLRDREVALVDSKQATLSKHSRHESDKLDRRHYEQSDLSSCESGYLDLPAKGEMTKGDLNKLLRRQDKKLIWTPISQSIPKYTSNSVHVQKVPLGEDDSSVDKTASFQQRSLACERAANSKTNHAKPPGRQQGPDSLVPRPTNAAKQSGKVEKLQTPASSLGRSSQQWETSNYKASPYLLFDSSEHPLPRARSKPQRSGQR